MAVVLGLVLWLGNMSGNYLCSLEGTGDIECRMEQLVFFRTDLYTQEALHNPSFT